MTPKYIPNEVLLQIFQRLSINSISVSLCCNSWKSAALEEFYKEITLTKDNIQIVQAVMEQKNDSLPTTFTTITNGEYVKILQIVDKSTSADATLAPFTREQLVSFLRCLPQWKRIDLTAAKDNGYMYLGYLQNVLKSNNDNESLTCLEDIVATSRDYFEMYRYFIACCAN